MKVLILSNAVALDASAADSDVLLQVAAVHDALLGLGHAVEHRECTLDLDSLQNEIRAAAPEVVFNLVESLGGSDRLAVLVPILLESLSVRFTGCGALAMHRTADKRLSKREMRRAGLPTPSDDSATETFPLNRPTRFIIKATYEHASVGMDDSSLVTVNAAHELDAACRAWTAHHGIACFAEEFIEGREFNLSMLTPRAGQCDPEVLPPAEIDFSAYPADRARVVGYSAKWDEQSFEYQNTPRCFDFPAADAALLERLKELAIECWRLFDLRGYARVDFRVDADNQPWILEVNTNPCLSPDAGFAAALAQAGVTYQDAIARMLAS